LKIKGLRLKKGEIKQSPAAEGKVPESAKDKKNRIGGRQKGGGIGGKKELD